MSDQITELGPAPELVDAPVEEVTIAENRRALAIQIASRYAETTSELFTYAAQVEAYLEDATVPAVE